uniref:Glycylpeptide N-tetradecanoyltransferase n=1 Tax=Panagrellus redivivus TaxID=6233 RepID=A0A7E4V123_PANRE
MHHNKKWTMINAEFLRRVASPTMGQQLVLKRGAVNEQHHPIITLARVSDSISVFDCEKPHSVGQHCRAGWQSTKQSGILNRKMSQKPSGKVGSQRYSMVPFVGVDVKEITVVVLKDYINTDDKYDCYAHNNFMLTVSFVHLGFRIRPIFLEEFEDVTKMVKIAREHHIKLIDYMISTVNPDHSDFYFIRGMTLQSIRNRAKARHDSLPCAVALVSDDPKESSRNKGKMWMDISIFLIFMSNLFYDMNREMAKLCIRYLMLHRMTKLSPTMAKIYGSFKRVLDDFHRHVKVFKLKGDSRRVFLNNDPYCIDLDH